MLIHTLLAARSDPRLRVIRRALGAHGVLLTRLRKPAQLQPALAREDFDLVVVDTTFLGPNPAAEVAAIRALPHRPEVVALTAGGPDAAALLAAGCLATLDLDLPYPAMREGLRTLIERRRREAARRVSEETLVARNRLSDFASGSPAMRNLISIARRVAASESTLLILGETGVGKEWLARAIHAESARADEPFVAVNCAAAPESLIESELFGHERGSFTGAERARRGQFEVAHRGTLFLDEVAETPAHIQVKLLRALQERRIRRVGAEGELEVDVRLMAATNRDPTAEIAGGRLRSDLYYRLGVVLLRVPPLRERREDIPLLATSYLERFRQRLARDVAAIDETAMEALVRYDWPGNVRELINVVERAVLLCAGGGVGAADLPEEISRAASPARAFAPAAGPARLPPLRTARRELVESFERGYLAEVLRRSSGRIGEAARRAGISTRALHAKMRVYGLRKEDFRAVLD